MTIPGELDKVPIKVVPIYLEPIVEPEPLEPEFVVEPEPEPEHAARRSTALVGSIALLAAFAAAVVTGIGVGVASSGAYDAGTVLAWVAIVISVAAVLGGAVAVIVGWGRRLGIAAIVIGILANPWLLATVLGALVAT